MAAAVYIPPSPHDPLSRMTTAARRAPLASIPNATNSPHRLLTTSGSKRSRAQASVSLQENEPPYKRQALEKNTADRGPATPTRQTPPNPGEGRVFDRGHGASGSTAFQRRLVAARDKTSGLRVTKNVEPPPKDENIRQWQKHYRKIFPQFHFYFDGVPEDVKARFIRNIASLGATEEKFFSKSVTHIITTKPIPPELDAQKIVDPTPPHDDQLSTINPSLLDKASNNFHSRSHAATTTRRDGSGNLDILQRGRQMGMKIWQAEKLQRVLATVLDNDSARAQQVRAATTTTRPVHEDLSQVLRNDRIGLPAERDPTTLFRELTHFKGPFIYIHDIDEKYKPTMVREYPSVSRRTDGEWPQFRSAGAGKCPFIEDPTLKKEMEAKHKAQQRQLQQEASQVPRTRSSVSLDVTKMDPPRRVSPRKALKEVHNIAPPPPPATINPGLLSRTNSRDSSLSFPPMPEQKFDFVRPPFLHIPREPAASGIQRSNITSAIQSNMISSTAATGVKAGTSKEVHELKRKVLERTHTGSLSVGSIPSSHRMNDLAGALKNSRGPAPQRAAKSKAQEKLGGIQEEDPYADDVAAERAAHAQRRKRSVQKEKEAKPGYCENCRDKYEDFEEHIVSRKHRKFAITTGNWTELDALLAKLQDP